MRRIQLNSKKNKTIISNREPLQYNVLHRGIILDNFTGNLLDNFAIHQLISVFF